MPIGTIKAVKVDRGFGFLRHQGDDLFFHCKELRSGLEFDEQLLELDVEFDLATCNGRSRAVNVRPVEDDIPQVRRHG